MPADSQVSVAGQHRRHIVPVDADVHLHFPAGRKRKKEGAFDYGCNQGTYQ